MNPMLLRRQTTRFVLSTLQRLAMLTVVTNLEWFRNNLDQFELIPPAIRQQLAEFIGLYVGDMTPMVLPLLLALGVQSVQIDFTLPDTHNQLVWSLHDVIMAFTQIAAKAHVVHIHFEFHEVYDNGRSWGFPRHQLHRMLAYMPQLQHLTLIGNCHVDHQMLENVSDTIQSINVCSNLNYNRMNDDSFVTLVSRKHQLLEIDLWMTCTLNPRSLLLALETLPNLQKLNHQCLEQALVLYSAKHKSRSLNLTFLTITKSETIETIVPLVPLLREVTFFCQIPRVNFQQWKWITSLIIHQGCDSIDELVELWGGQLLKLHIAPTQAVNCSQIITTCRSLEYLLLGNILDSNQQQLEMQIPNQFKLSEFYYLPNNNMHLESQPTFWLTHFLKAPNLKKVILNRVNINFLLPVLQTNQSFCNLSSVTLKNCIFDQETILEWIFGAPYLKEFYLNNCEGQTQIHREITRNPNFNKEVTLKSGHMLGINILDVIMKRPTL